MIKGFILYYLSIKPTHGYEIQRFIQLSGMDQWTNVQSGSIYYALTKLEKGKFIKVQKEERTGSRIRKIYEITDLGREELEKEMRIELASPIMETDSLKFITYPMVSILALQEAKSIIEKHISELEDKKKYWESWKEIKGKMSGSRLTRLSFDMTIHSLEDQIIWHQELLNSLEEYRKESGDMEMMIKSFELDSITGFSQEDVKQTGSQDNSAFIQKIKEYMEKDPSGAMEQLNMLMEEVKKQEK